VSGLVLVDCKHGAVTRREQCFLLSYLLIQQAVLWAVFFVIAEGTGRFWTVIINAWSATTLLWLLMLLTRLPIDMRTLLIGFVATASVFLATFSELYWSYGVGRNFNGRLTRLDAVFVAVGTVSTAGTGNIVARSQAARAIQLVEMLLGMALVLGGAGTVLARVAAEPLRRRGPADGKRTGTDA
jgi:hypothetical protein